VENSCTKVSKNREQRSSSTPPPTGYEDAALLSDLEDRHPACVQGNRNINQVEILCKYYARFLEVSTNML
jgi:hypothetical protein